MVNPIHAPEVPLRVLLGSIRAEIDVNNAVRLSNDRTATSLIAASEARNGKWVFVTMDGLVVRSESFLGPIERAGESNGDAFRVAVGRGAIYYRDRRHQGWLATVEHGVRKWPDVAVLSGAFLSPERGAYIDFAGDLWVTSDAGRSAQKVSLTPQSADMIEIRHDRLEVSTSAGHRLLLDNRTLEPIPAAPPFTRELTAARRWALLQAALLRWPQSVWSLIDNLQGSLDSPWFVFDRDIVQVDPNSGAIQSVDRDVLPNRDCAVRAWGSRYLINCPPSEQSFLWSREEGRRLFSSPRFREILLSNDGQHALSNEPCVEPNYAISSRRFDASNSCVWLSNSTRWSPLGAASRFSHSDALNGSRAIGQFLSGSQMILRIRDIESGASDLLSSEPGPEGARREVMSGQFAADGTPYGLMVAERTAQTLAAEPSFLMARWPDLRAVVSPSPLPTGFQALGMQTASNGYAVGATGSEIWQTLDGGAQWQHLELPIDGAPGAIEVHANYSRRQYLPCSLDRCLLGGFLVEGSGPIVPFGERVLASTTPFVVSNMQRWQSMLRSAYQGRISGVETRRFVCTLVRSIPSAGGHRLRGADIELALHATETADHHIALSGSWTFGDSAPSTMVPGLAPLPVTGARHAMPPDTGWTVRYGTRDWVLVDRCVISDPPRRCDHLIVSRTSAPTRLAVDENVTVLDQDDGAFLAATKTRPGVHALLFNTSANSEQCSEVLVLVNDSASTLARRHMSCPGMEPFDAALAIRENLLGIIRLQRSALDSIPSAHAFFPLFNGAVAVNEPAQPLPSFNANGTSVLNRATRLPNPHSLLVFGAGAGLSATASYSERYYSDWNGRVEAELAPNGDWTIRSLQSAQRSGRGGMDGRGPPPVSGAISVHTPTTAGAHVLEGTFRDDRRTVYVQCEEMQ